MVVFSNLWFVISSKAARLLILMFSPGWQSTLSDANTLELVATIYQLEWCNHAMTKIDRRIPSIQWNMLRGDAFRGIWTGMRMALFLNPCHGHLYSRIKPLYAETSGYFVSRSYMMVDLFSICVENVAYIGQSWSKKTWTVVVLLCGIVGVEGK